MLEFVAPAIHYISIIAVVVVTAFGVSLGQGITATGAILASNQQPQANTDIKTVMYISMALTETTAIIGLLSALLMLRSPYAQHPNIYVAIAQLGQTFAICLAGLPLSLLCAQPSYAACEAISRQPTISGKIVRLFLLSLSVLQTPIIFAFIVSFLIRLQIPAVTGLADSLRLLGAGLSIGLGSVGPVIGLATLAKAGCQATGMNKNAFESILFVNVISQAFVETPVLLSLVISLFILFTGQGSDLASFAKFLGGICVALSTIAVGISSGKIAANVCYQLTEKPELTTDLSRIGMFCQAFVETCTLYGFVVAMLLVTM